MNRPINSLWDGKPRQHAPLLQLLKAELTGLA